MKQTAVEWLEKAIKDTFYVAESSEMAKRFESIFKEGKQMEAEQSKIPELSDEEIKEKMFGGQYDGQDINDVGEFEAAKWYREQLKQRQ